VLESSRRRQAALAAAVALTVLRSLVPLIEQQVNADEALVGLMAKHLVEGRAFPLHLYSLPHMLGITSWVTAPFFAAGGATVVMLKLPLVLMNAAVAWLLVDGFQRGMRLPPLTSLIAALPFILAPPFLSHLHFIDAGGGSPEPLLFVLILWLLRDKPLAFGAVLGVGVLNRPFAGYGAVALFAVQAWERTIFQPRVWKGWLTAAVAFAAVWDLTNSVRVWASPRGPGTLYDGTLPDVVAANTAFACFDPAAVVTGTWTFSRDVLPFMLGALRPLPSLPWAALIIVIAAIARVAWLARREQLASTSPSLAFGIYVMLTGVLSAEVYVTARCGYVDVETMRYALLTPFALIGALAILFALEPWRLVRLGVAVAVCVWALAQLVDHGQLLARAIRNGPASPRRELARYLEDHHVRYAWAPFWDAQALDFLTQEHVVVASEDVVRITLYQDQVSAHADEAVRVSHKPCVSGGVEAVKNVYWLCPLP
jgi:hypothetical protein